MARFCFAIVILRNDYMILEWKIKCDACNKIIDAKKESFIDGEYGQFCKGCEIFG